MREISVTFLPRAFLSVSHAFVRCGPVINILYLQIFLNIHSVCGILSWLDAVNTLWHVLCFTFNQDRKKWVQVYSCFHNLCLFRKLVFPSCFFCPHAPLLAFPHSALSTLWLILPQSLQFPTVLPVQKYWTGSIPSLFSQGCFSN